MLRMGGKKSRKTFDVNSCPHTTYTRHCSVLFYSQFFFLSLCCLHVYCIERDNLEIGNSYLIELLHKRRNCKRPSLSKSQNPFKNSISFLKVYKNLSRSFFSDVQMIHFLYRISSPACICLSIYASLACSTLKAEVMELDESKKKVHEHIKPNSQNRKKHGSLFCIQNRGLLIKIDFVRRKWCTH